MDLVYGDFTPDHVGPFANASRPQKKDYIFNKPYDIHPPPPQGIPLHSDVYQPVYQGMKKALMIVS